MSPEPQAAAHSITTVTTDDARNVVRRLFGEYQRDVERHLTGTDICP